MTYFLFNNPGEKTAMLVSYQKKEELGTACFYNTYISWTRNQSKTWPALSNKKKMEGHKQKRELLMKKTTAPFPSSIILNQRKKGDKKRTPEASQILT
jgi:hypothetical protein